MLAGSLTTRRLAAIAVGALLSTAVACGSGGGSDGQVTLRFTWWGNDDRAALTEKAVDEFEKRHSDITVETEFAEFDAYFQKLATQIAGGNAPDVLQMDYRYVREYAGRDALRELGNGPAAVDTSGVSQTLLSGGTVDGRLYGMPVAQNTQEFTYDPAQWQRAGAAAPTAGWTWDDLEVAAQKVSDATGGRVRGVSDFGGIEDWFEVWLRQQGRQLYTDDGKLGYTADDVARYWELADGLRRSGAATPAEVTTKIDGALANDPVAQKTASSGFGYDSGLTPQTWTLFGREMALATFPTDTGTLGQYAKPAMMFSVSRRSSHPAEAAELVDFLINDPDAGKILGMSRGLPANERVRQAVSTTLEGPPLVAYQFEQAVGPDLADAPPPPPQGAGTVKAAFQRVYEDVIFEKSTPAEAADRFMSEARDALES